MIEWLGVVWVLNKWNDSSTLRVQTGCHLESDLFDIKFFQIEKLLTTNASQRVACMNEISFNLLLLPCLPVYLFCTRSLNFYPFTSVCTLSHGIAFLLLLLLLSNAAINFNQIFISCATHSLSTIFCTFPQNEALLLAKKTFDIGVTTWRCKYTATIKKPFACWIFQWKYEQFSEIHRSSIFSLHTHISPPKYLLNRIHISNMRRVMLKILDMCWNSNSLQAESFQRFECVDLIDGCKFQPQTSTQVVHASSLFAVNHTSSKPTRTHRWWFFSALEQKSLQLTMWTYKKIVFQETNALDVNGVFVYFV